MEEQNKPKKRTKFGAILASMFLAATSLLGLSSSTKAMSDSPPPLLVEDSHKTHDPFSKPSSTKILGREQDLARQIQTLANNTASLSGENDSILSEVYKIADECESLNSGIQELARQVEVNLESTKNADEIAKQAANDAHYYLDGLKDTPETGKEIEIEIETESGKKTVPETEALKVTAKADEDFQQAESYVQEINQYAYGYTNSETNQHVSGAVDLANSASNYVTVSYQAKQDANTNHSIVGGYINRTAELAKASKKCIQETYEFFEHQPPTFVSKRSDTDKAIVTSGLLNRLSGYLEETQYQPKMF